MSSYYLCERKLSFREKVEGTIFYRIPTYHLVRAKNKFHLICNSSLKGLKVRERLVIIREHKGDR